MPKKSKSGGPFAGGKNFFEKGIDILEYLNIIILETAREATQVENEMAYARRAELLKALSHPLRLRIVRGLLINGCRNVGCMEEHTGQSQSCISQHLMRLKAAGVVRAARAGNEVYYEVADPAAAAVVSALFGDRAEDYQWTAEEAAGNQ